MATAAGYSGTPLTRKLGFKPGMRVWVDGAPAGYVEALEPLPPGLSFLQALSPEVELANVFLSTRAALADGLSRARRTLDTEASLWISWPKKASGLPSEVTEDVVRELALPLGFVDIKVCAVDAVWSGLKLVVRKSLR